MDLNKDFEVMKDFYSKLADNFEGVELTMEGEVLVIKIKPKGK